MVSYIAIWCPLLGKPTVSLLTTYLKDVVEWKEFGTHLLPDESVTEIDTISKNYPNDMKECKRQLYVVFQKQGTYTWEKVVEALEKSNYPHIAKEIKTAFLQK